MESFTKSTDKKILLPPKYYEIAKINYKICAYYFKGNATKAQTTNYLIWNQLSHLALSSYISHINFTAKQRLLCSNKPLTSTCT